MGMNHKAVKMAVLAAALGALVGCQGVAPATKSASLDNAGFMSLGRPSRHCESGADLMAMRDDALPLAGAARDARPTKPAVPAAFKPYFADPPHRLAVEPTAMAVACGLQAG